MLTEQERFMKKPSVRRKKPGLWEEVPIGCVIVCDGKIIARGYNRRNTDKNTLSHAELNATKASKKLGDWQPGGLYYVRDPGAVSDVCRSAGTVQDRPGGDWKHESKSRMRRISAESFGNGWI